MRECRDCGRESPDDYEICDCGAALPAAGATPGPEGGELQGSGSDEPPCTRGQTNADAVDAPDQERARRLLVRRCIAQAVGPAVAFGALCGYLEGSALEGVAIGTIAFVVLALGALCLYPWLDKLRGGARR
ncbi:MAG: hypothetical protein FJX74_12575 [Armatimonadetes bacterium]|nr:hypothetical protein [Armatimonadota bacterium]